jgi:hypothetical protein
MAEGEELQTNLLQVSQRGPASSSVLDEVFGTHKVLIQRLEFDNRMAVVASGPECDRRR